MTLVLGKSASNVKHTNTRKPENLANHKGKMLPRSIMHNLPQIHNFDTDTILCKVE